MDRSHLRKAIQLFNQGEYFAAHEVFEEVWRDAPVEEKRFLQGLTQIAVAFHHHSTGNRIGACSLLKKAFNNLSMAGIELPIPGSALLKRVKCWGDCLSQNTPMSEMPRLDSCEI
jgi:predicted metal-dependent hydrolase